MCTDYLLCGWILCDFLHQTLGKPHIGLICTYTYSAKSASFANVEEWGTLKWTVLQKMSGIVLTLYYLSLILSTGKNSYHLTKYLWCSVKGTYNLSCVVWNEKIIWNIHISFVFQQTARKLYISRRRLGNMEIFICHLYTRIEIYIYTLKWTKSLPIVKCQYLWENITKYLHGVPWMKYVNFVRYTP